ncbi:MAG: glycosyltransferase family A protein, partial [Alphaproteobacteria bacterium]
MLAACLESILPQQVPDGWRFCLVVIDNDCTASASEVVQGFAARAPFPVHYGHEPVPGIPIARNRALDTALSLGADWITCVDDDERLAPDWLPKMIAAIEEKHGDVIQGPVVYEWPDVFWCPDREKKHRPDG